MSKLLNLKEIRIENFLSIKEQISIPVQKYGNSFTTIFVGKNDSGKTNLLKALAFLELEGKSIKYTDYCHRDYKNETDKYIDIFYDFQVLDNKELSKIIKEMNIFPENFHLLFTITDITKIYILKRIYQM